MLAGTDNGNPFCLPGFSLHDELALMVESGVTPVGALQAATRNAAVFMEASDKYGFVGRGKVADLVLLNADPIKDNSLHHEDLRSFPGRERARSCRAGPHAGGSGDGRKGRSSKARILV